MHLQLVGGHSSLQKMDVLDDNEKLKNTYKNIELYPHLNVDHARADDRKKALVSDSFRPCVSFNTVPSYLGNPSEDNGDDGLDFPGVQFPQDYTMEEFYDDESGYMSDNAEYYLRNNYLTNDSLRGASPPPKGKFASLSSMFKIAENGKIVRVDYPSRPTILSDAIIVNRVQPCWKGLWNKKRTKMEERMNDKTKYFKYPTIIFDQQPASKSKVATDDGYTLISKEQRRKEKVLQEKVGYPNIPRTILCHLSGRRHTWVALDWALRELAQDTDHIVVIANLPRFSPSIHPRSHSRARSRNRSQIRDKDYQLRSLSVGARNSDNAEKHENFAEWTSGYSEDVIVSKLEDILTYIAVIIPKEISLKVTVEIVIGRTKKIMLDAMNTYTPDLCVSSTLKWERTDNLVVWKSKNLTDILCTTFPVPVFVAPVKRMADFEAKLQQQFLPSASTYVQSPTNAKLVDQTSDVSVPQADIIAKRDKGDVHSGSKDSSSLNTGSSHEVPDSAPLGVDQGEDDDEKDDEEEDDDEEDDDEDDTPGILPVKERLRLAVKRHRAEMLKRLTELETNKGISRSEIELVRLDYILESSLKFSAEVEDISKEYEGNESGFDQLKRVITGGTEVYPNSKRSMLDVLDPPKTNSTSGSSGRSRSGQIKFASNVHAKDGHRALGNAKNKPPSAENSRSSRSRNLSPVEHVRSLNTPSSNNDMKPLRKMKSTGSPPANSLHTVRSANSLSHVKSNDSIGSGGSSGSSKKKSSGGGFLSIFKSGSSRSRSTSRRNSSGSDSDRLSLKDSEEGKKRRSKLFGFT